MISLFCQTCQRKLQAKDEFAGKKLRCPGCKQAIRVPQPGEVPAGNQPAAPVDSSQSAQESGSQQQENGSLQAPARYELADEIARGGMGAIVRAVDQDIHREVAVKFLLNQADDQQKARFMEEAQITGQLEHPNIVPIHQLGSHPDGRCFFSMKMVRGRTLKEIIKKPRPEDTLGRQLTIFVAICNAMAYAHSRDVVHRDLKPANIMIGDFGEVYVMDWGLAKVIGKDDPAPSTSDEPPAEEQAAAEPSLPEIVDAASSGSSLASSKLSTYRQTIGGDLTQDGAIMGTVMYMPPEQALGEEVDTRADIYSLGAILYEIMTLTPPVGRDGDMMAALMRVVEGKIDPPRKRAPQRAKAGWIPAELAAIALKALSTERQDRYQTAEELRRDVELYTEGRSVSAKQDSFREMAWKLVKRNKGASITAAAALAVLLVVAGVFLKFNYDARIVAETERGKAEDAYDAYQQQVKDSAPILLRAATAALKERRFDDAVAQAELAVKSDPASAAARLLLGQLLIAEQRFSDALAQLEASLKLPGADAAAQQQTQQLVELCRGAKGDDVASLLAFASHFSSRQQHALADGVLRGQGKNAVEARQQVLALYQSRIETKWPGKGDALKMSKEGLLSFSWKKKDPQDHTDDLTPLRGIPLSSLDLYGHDQLRDLRPLRGMPLKNFQIYNSPVSDLEPLRGMPLTSVSLARCAIHDLGPLQDSPLESLTISFEPIRNLDPLRGMPLTTLQLAGGRLIRTLEPLKGMKITSLNLSGCYEIETLAPLAGMEFTYLSVENGKKITDLSPLRASEKTLKTLHLNGSGVSDLTPLKGMNLENVTLLPEEINQSLEILRNMQSIRKLGLSPVQTLFPPEDFWRKYDAGEFAK